MLSEIKTILYSTDLKGKGTENAFRMAAGLAQSTGAHMVVLHAIEPTALDIAPAIKNMLSDDLLEKFKSEGVQEHKEQIEQRLKEFCDRECPDGNLPGGKPTIVVEQGKPQRLILDIAEKHNADLIVMGTRTHITLGDGLLGSTATKVIHRSKIPVLIYPL